MDAASITVSKPNFTTIRTDSASAMSGGSAPKARPKAERLPPEKLPIVMLPGGSQTISATAAKLGALLKTRETHFARGEGVVRVVAAENGTPQTAPVLPTSLQSDFEKVAELRKWRIVKGEAVQQREICYEATAKAILNAQDFVKALPQLTLLSACPLLIERSGKLRLVAGYDAETGILAAGAPPEKVALDEAKTLLDEMLADFNFVSPSDRSRALAALITPALVFGGLLPGRAPLDLGEADESQSGKGWRHKLTAAIYGRFVSTVARPEGRGVGSLDEGFDARLIAGHNFISLDNVRGKIESQKIESFLTEDTYNARCSKSRNIEIDPRRIYVMLTSNRSEPTKDLAKRSSCVRIVKQPNGYEFRKFPEGDILDHVRAQQPKYLGAVFTIIREWHAAGKERTAETRHARREWAQILDWIVQNLLDAAPLLDGHAEIQHRMTDKNLLWLRDVVIAIRDQGKISQQLRASGILDVLDEHGDIEIPGIRDGADIEDSLVREQAYRQIGRRLGKCFPAMEDDQAIVQVDGLEIVRDYFKDEGGRDRYGYTVYPLGEAPPYVPF